jgi:hypothetical protein
LKIVRRRLTLNEEAFDRVEAQIQRIQIRVQDWCPLYPSHKHLRDVGKQKIEQLTGKEQNMHRMVSIQQENH